MNVLDLARSLSIEVDQLLASGGTSSLLIVWSQAWEKGVGLLCYTVWLINRLGLVGSFVFLVDALQGVEEARGYT
jgi:hypothetical protein